MRAVIEAVRSFNARGWIGVGTFGLTVLVLAMLWSSEALRRDEFFKTIATLIVGAYIKDVVGWAFSATQVGGELAKKNAEIVADSAAASRGN